MRQGGAWNACSTGGTLSTAAVRSDAKRKNRIFMRRRGIHVSGRASTELDQVAPGREVISDGNGTDRTGTEDRQLDNRGIDRCGNLSAGRIKGVG